MLRIYPVHHPADIGQASSAFGIPVGAVAATGFFLGGDFFQNQGTVVLNEIRFNNFPGIPEAITDQLIRSKRKRFLG